MKYVSIINFFLQNDNSIVYTPESGFQKLNYGGQI